MALTSPPTTSSAMSTPAAVDSAALRSYPNCRRRMSSLKHDSHTICSHCRAVSCSVETRCSECKDWSVDTLQEHLKYQRSLAGTRGSRKPVVTAASGSQPAVTSSPVVSSPHLAPSVSESSQLKDAVLAVLQSLQGSLGINIDSSTAPSTVPDSAPSVGGATGGVHGMKLHNVDSRFEFPGVGALVPLPPSLLPCLLLYLLLIRGRLFLLILLLSPLFLLLFCPLPPLPFLLSLLPSLLLSCPWLPSLPLPSCPLPFLLPHPRPSLPLLLPLCLMFRFLLPLSFRLLFLPLPPQSSLTPPVPPPPGFPASSFSSQTAASSSSASTLPLPPLSLFASASSFLSAPAPPLSGAPASSSLPPSSSSSSSSSLGAVSSLADHQAHLLGLSSEYQSLARWFLTSGSSDFAALVHSSFPHLLSDLSRDFSSGSSLFLATLRLAPATSSSPTSSSSLSSTSHPPLSAHLSSSCLPGGLAPPPSYSLSPAFPPPAPPSSAFPPPPGFPPLSASASLSSVWVSRLLLGFPLTRLTRLLMHLLLPLPPPRGLPLTLLTPLHHRLRVLQRISCLMTMMTVSRVMSMTLSTPRLLRWPWSLRAPNMIVYICGLFPQAVGVPPSAPPPCALFESFFAPATPSLQLNWFDRVHGSLMKADSRVASILPSGCPERVVLPQRLTS